MAVTYAVSTKFVAIDGLSTMFKRMVTAGASATGKVKSMFASMSNQINKVLGSTMGQLAQIAGITGGVYMIKTAIDDTIQSGLQFEQTLVNAAVKFGKAALPGSAAYEKLNQKAREIGLTTEYTATQAAESFRLLGAAGFDAGQTVAASSMMMDMATAAEIDLNTASISAANALAVFNLKTNDSIQLQKNMARVSDTMVAAVNAATLETEDYLETMKMAGPTFSAAKRPVEEFAAMTAILAEGGIKGSMAGTTLNTAILRLMAPAAKGRKALAAVGVSATDATGQLKPMQQIIEELAKAQQNQTDKQKIASLNAIFGQYAVKGMLKVMQGGPEAIKAMSDKIYEGAGATSEMAKVMRDTTENKIKLMKSAVEGLQLQIFEGLKPAIVEVTNSIGEWSNSMASYFKENPKRVGQIIDMTKKISLMIITLYGLAKAIALINFLWSLNPAVLAIHLTAAAITGIILLCDDWGTAIKWVTTLIVAMFMAFELGIAVVTGGMAPLIKILIGAFVLLITHSQTFRDIFIATIITIGGLIANALLYPLLGVAKIINGIAKLVGLTGFDSSVKLISETIDTINVTRDQAWSDVFSSEDKGENKPQITTPEIGQAQVSSQNYSDMMTTIEKNITENRLIVEDRTGKARMEGKPNGAYQLKRTTVSR